MTREELHALVDTQFDELDAIQSQPTWQWPLAVSHQQAQ